MTRPERSDRAWTETDPGGRFRISVRSASDTAGRSTSGCPASSAHRGRTGALEPPAVLTPADSIEVLPPDRLPRSSTASDVRPGGEDSPRQQPDVPPLNPLMRRQFALTEPHKMQWVSNTRGDDGPDVEIEVGPAVPSSTDARSHSVVDRGMAPCTGDAHALEPSVLGDLAPEGPHGVVANPLHGRGRIRPVGRVEPTGREGFGVKLDDAVKETPRCEELREHSPLVDPQQPAMYVSFCHTWPRILLCNTRSRHACKSTLSNARRGRRRLRSGCRPHGSDGEGGPRGSPDGGPPVQSAAGVPLAGVSLRVTHPERGVTREP